MIKRIFACFIVTGLLGAPPARAEDTPDKSPSHEKEEWTKNDVFYEFSTDYSHVGGATTSLGNGQNAPISEENLHLEHFFARKYFRCLLVKTGLEWQGFYFNAPVAGFVPDHLHDLNALGAIDFRWSRQDLLRLQARPGFYTDFRDVRFADDINCPLALAYTRVSSMRFQWFVALSYNMWRRHSLLPAGGFRWQLTDRWKLKMLFPEPHIEYQARDDLHLFVGGDFRGDSFRLGRDFGDIRGDSRFNNTVVDFQEIRAGGGFSWNVKPLVEINLHGGYMVYRQFDYHDVGVQLNSDPAPYITFNVNVLFELPEALRSPDTESGNFEIPIPGVTLPVINGLPSINGVGK
jgi:hypothetical protein